MPESTITLHANQIQTRSALETAIRLALHASDDERPSMRRVVERAATMLDAEDLLPEPLSWARPTKTTAATPARDQASLKILDQPPAALMELENRATLDQAVRVIARELDVDYTTALGRFQDSVRTGRELVKAKPDDMGVVLHRAGVKSLDAFSADLKLLERRDAELTRVLEAAQAQLDQDAVDAQGRVMLSSDFDIARDRHDDEERERRWRRARDLDRRYSERSVFDQEDEMAYEGGADLVKTLERPIIAAEARQRVDAVAKELDEAIDPSREASASARVKALDAVVSGIPAAVPDPPNIATGNAPLHAQIEAHRKQHGCDYLCGLQAVTDVGLGRPGVA